MSRFAEPQDPDFASINRSLDVDKRLWPYDVAQSRAHARMLAAREIISDDDRDALLAALDAVEAELRDGTLPVRATPTRTSTWPSSAALTEIAGPVGGRLHTARSRNDQVATDVALFVREAAAEAQRRGSRTLMRGAASTPPRRHIDWPLPGYTHLQRAQPVYLGHHLLAYFWMLARDRERFAFAAAQAARPAARRRRAGRRELRHRPRAWSPTSSGSTA